MKSYNPRQSSCHHYHTYSDILGGFLHVSRQSFSKSIVFKHYSFALLFHSVMFSLPQAQASQLAELWARLTPPPPCRRPSVGGYGTAGHPPEGRPTDPASPLNLC